MAQFVMCAGPNADIAKKREVCITRNGCLFGLSHLQSTASGRGKNSNLYKVVSFRVYRVKG